MTQDKRTGHIVDLLFVIALLFMFAFSVLMLIGIGASVYRRNVEVMADNSGQRISYAYITEKLRQSDREGGISTGSLGGQDALILTDTSGEVPVRTYLYVYDGMLYELVTALGAQDSYSPGAGQPITALSELTTEVKDGLICLTIKRTTGETRTVYLAVRSEGER